MSLRYKALIAVVLLVAFLTGFLVVSSSTLFEQDARDRINEELRKDKQLLEARLRAAEVVSRTGIRASAASSELVQLFNDRGITTLAENLYPFAQEWRRSAEADIALAALDTFVAEDRGATQLLPAGENDPLAFVSIAERTESDQAWRTRLMTDPELVGFMKRFYERALKKGDSKDMKESDSAVLPVADRVYLVVQNYLWESVQDKLVIGVAVVLTELSRDWLQRAYGDEADEIEKIVFTGEVVASSTLPEMADADAIVGGARETGIIREVKEMRPFEFQYAGATHLGIAFSSELSPADMPNRPGFVAFKNFDNELAPFIKLRRNVFLIGAGLGLIAAVLAYFGANLVIRKLRRLELATTKIREGKFDTKVRIGGRDELAKLGKAFNDMTVGLKALGMYTHDTLAKSVMDNPELVGTTSQRAEGSIFFSDIKGFTSISENLSAEQLTSQLNEYFSALGHKMKEQRGYVDKFIGDGIMAFWGPPFVKEGDFAVRACETAISSFKIAAALRLEWAKVGKPLFFQRIGIATGEVVIGNIGTATKKNFTVIGDSVNLASRLEGANKVYGTEVLVDERTRELAKSWVIFREVDQIKVVGKQKPVRVFEPLAMVGGETASYAHQYFDYEKALGLYRQRQFGQAIEFLRHMLALKPEDGPSRWLLKECERLQRAVPDNWEPVTTATSK
jgi:class 3 adenylate cyclase